MKPKSFWICLGIFLILVNQWSSAAANRIAMVDTGQRLQRGYNSEVAAFGDFDGDGDLDIILANQSNPCTLLLNDGTGHFTERQASSDILFAFGIAAGDLDGDGHADVFVVNSTSKRGGRVLLNNWRNNWNPFPFIMQKDQNGKEVKLGNSWGQDVALRDVDQDGDLDAVVANAMSVPGIQVWLNDGQANFTLGQTLGDQDTWGVALADVNGDTYLDIVSANSDPAMVWFNDGYGHFNDSGQRLGNASNSSVALGDLNKDGYTDIFLTNKLGQGDTVWFNDGQGVFTDSGQRLGNFQSAKVALVDLDNDGDPDAYVATDAGQPDVVWWNDGQGNFSDSGMRLGSADDTCVIVGDIDGDGDQDVLATSPTAGSVVYQNQGRLIFVIKPGKALTDPDLQALLASVKVTPIPLFDDTRGNLSLKAALGMLRTYYIEPSSSFDLEALRQKFLDLDAIEKCIYDHFLTLDYTPSDPDFSAKQTNLQQINMPDAWEVTQGNSSVVLAIIDGSIYPSCPHPDLQTQLFAPPKDFTNTIEDGYYYDHGMHVAGIVAAAHNTAGIAGICPACKLLPLNVVVTSEQGASARFDAIFRAIEYAVDEKLTNPAISALAINMSLSAPLAKLSINSDELAQSLDIFHKWIQYAYLSNVPIVTSMGNLNWGFPHYPAFYDEVIAVGATDTTIPNETRWVTIDNSRGSNYGSWLDLVAPGVGIYSTLQGRETTDSGGCILTSEGQYGSKTGTSMSTPHVTGVLGLLLSQNPHYTVKELADMLKDMAKRNFQDYNPVYYGAGRLEAAQTLACAEGAHIVITPSEYDFGSLPIGETTTANVTITNPCKTAIHLQTIQFKSPFEPNSGWEQFSGQSQCAGQTLAPGASCAMSVDFQPVKEGNQWAMLHLSLSQFCCDAVNPQPSNLQLLFAGIGAPALTPTPSPSPTPTLTATPDPTVTPTPSPTPTLTATPAPTPDSTVTPTLTPTSTPTPTVTVISTGTPVPPLTPTVTPSLTSTQTPTPAISITATPTFAPTATPTTAATVTPVPLTIPELVPTATPTVTPVMMTPTAALTITPTPLLAATATPTISRSPTAQPTPTGTPDRPAPPVFLDELTPTPSPSVTVASNPVAQPTSQPIVPSQAAAPIPLSPTTLSTPVATALPTPTPKMSATLKDRLGLTTAPLHPTALPLAPTPVVFASAPTPKTEIVEIVSENPPDSQKELEQQAIRAYTDGDFQRAGDLFKQLGLESLQRDNYLEAITYYERAVESLARVDSHVQDILNLIAQGDAADAQGLGGDALDSYQKALVIIHETGSFVYEPYIAERLAMLKPVIDQPELSNIPAIRPAQTLSDALRGIADDFQMIAPPQPVNPILTEFADTFERTGDMQEAVDACVQAAIEYMSQGELQRAAQMLNRADELRNQIQDERMQVEANMKIENARGTLYYLTGAYDRAQPHYSTALELAQTLNNQPAQATILNNLALADYQEGQAQEKAGQPEKAQQLYDSARRNLDDAHEIARNAAERLTSGTILNNIGLVQAAQPALRGNLSESETDRFEAYQNIIRTYQASLAIIELFGSPASLGATWHNLGELYFKIGENANALDVLARALTLEQQSGNRVDEAKTQSDIGFIHEQQNEWQAAFEAYLKSLNIQEMLRAAAKLDEFKIGLDAQAFDVYQRAFLTALQLQKPEEALALSERARSRAFLDQLGNERLNIRIGVSEYLLQREYALRLELMQLYQQLRQECGQALFETKAIDDSKAKIALKQSEYDDLLINIKASSPEYASLISVTPMELRQIQAILDDDLTLISYFVTPEKAMAFVITRTAFVPVELPVGGRTLDDALKIALRKPSAAELAQFSSQDPVFQYLQQTYSWLITPVKPYIKTKIVGIIPHGVLNNLSFAALTAPSPVEIAPRYLGDEYLLFSLPSLSVWKFISEKRRKSGEGTILTFGYDASAAEDVMPLEYAEKEAKEIAAMYGVEAHIGDAATESAVKSLAEQARILHVSSHANLDVAHPFRTHLLLRPNTENDGRFEVAEAYNLLLRQAELVILNACNTAQGTLSRGDERIALNRAFIYAGSPSVIGSLWNVADRAGYDFMLAFHKFFKSGLSKAEAMQKAQQETRQQHPHPYHWAAVMLTGDPGKGTPPIAAASTPSEKQTRPTPTPSGANIVESTPTPSITPTPTPTPTIGSGDVNFPSLWNVVAGMAAALILLGIIRRWVKHE